MGLVDSGEVCLIQLLWLMVRCSFGVNEEAKDLSYGINGRQQVSSRSVSSMIGWLAFLWCHVWFYFLWFGCWPLFVSPFPGLLSSPVCGVVLSFFGAHLYSTSDLGAVRGVTAKRRM